MDSRRKIGSPLPEAATIVRGHFDPLLAAHAAQLAEFPRPLAVIIADTPAPLLPLEARQLMVAACACVDCVLLQDSNPHHDLVPEHDAWKAAFIRQVKDRADA